MPLIRKTRTGAIKSNMHCFNAGPFTPDAKKDADNEYSICTRSDSFFLIQASQSSLVIGIHDSMKECMAAAAEQKIPGNCYPVE